MAVVNHMQLAISEFPLAANWLEQVSFLANLHWRQALADQSFRFLLSNQEALRALTSTPKIVTPGSSRCLATSGRKLLAQFHLGDEMLPSTGICFLDFTNRSLIYREKQYWQGLTLCNGNTIWGYGINLTSYYVFLCYHYTWDGSYWNRKSREIHVQGHWGI